MAEQLGNLAQSTLAADITSGATSITVASATGFPTAPFRAVITNGSITEIVLVTAKAGTTFTVTRAQESTTGVAWSTGDSIAHVLTAGALAQRRAETVTVGGYLTEPGAGESGRLYLPSDNVVAGHDNGSTWDRFGPLMSFTEPDLTAFTAINQGSATATQEGAIVYAEAPPSGTANVRAWVKSAPATPYKITLAFLPLLWPANNSNCGILFRDSATGKIVAFRIVFSSDAINLDNSKFTNATSFSAAYGTSGGSFMMSGPCMWLRIQDNGTNRLSDFSVDGVHWRTWHTIGRTDFLTADQVGFYVASDQAVNSVGMTILNWNES